TNGAPWHHDEPYFDFFGGRKCVLWFPLESASRDEGLTFLAGSHRWGRLYMPQNFREHRPFDGDLAGYHVIGDFEQYHDRFLSWDLEPGDCLVFDFRTLHRATNCTDPLPRTIHRMSLRYGDQDVVFRPRGDWTRETSEYLAALGQRRSRAPETPLTPLVSSEPQKAS
ncbi:MAG TPA: phytanoyl-CoA dioxygenase family protein, partial [Arenicellales bacterium]|nr:phytanoyl-CoA dioxygenase family protein [Arenicellales bacterium]